MNDGGMTEVFSPQRARVCVETSLKLVGCIELKRENRTFWNVQRMMALRREQHVAQVEQIAGNPVLKRRPRHARQRRSPGCMGTKTSAWTHD